MGRFIVFELFYQLQFFISWDRITFKLAYPKIDQFGTTFHTERACLSRFIRMAQFDMYSVIFHQLLLEFGVKSLYRN
jgi:hypothetical protein